MAAITLSNLSIRFGAAAVIEGLDLVVEQGRFFTLLGPSGCGKTTLLRAIAGFNTPSAGRILFDDKDITRTPPHQRDIGMVFQDYALFPDKTVFDNVAFGLRARGLTETEVRSRVLRYLERVELGPYAGRHPAQMSGGQRQRVALARALVIQPQVLLMDEPLSNLDAKLRMQMREAILDLQREAGITTVFVTHDQEEALAMSDAIAVMNRGRIEQLGSPEQLYGSPATAYVADFIGAANVLPVQPGAVGGAGSGADGLVRCRLAGYPLLAQLRIPRSSDAAACLVARPEDISIRSSAGIDEPLIPARIVRKQYLGFKTSYKAVVIAAAGTGDAELPPISIDSYAGGRQGNFAVGSEVFLSFSAACSIVAAPAPDPAREAAATVGASAAAAATSAPAAA
jgi:iron(III) transport system ATP-binding protein